MKNNYPLSKRTSRGVTLTELVVVIAIVSLLATILLPVAFNRMEQARIVVAKEEVRNIAEAMQQCAAIHGYYVPIRVLDNLHGNIDPTTTDDIENEIGAVTYLIHATRNVNLQIADGQLEIGESGTERFINEWNGPFLNPQRVYVDEGAAVGSEDWWREDMPLDPWGNPYRFYSRLGYIGESRVRSQNPSDWDGAFTGELNNVGDSIYDELQGYAIVSYGPNGEEELYEDPSDDIIYEFGAEFDQEQMKPFY